MINRKIFSKTVIELLARDGKSKAALARDMSITRQTINSWLTLQALPTADKLDELADYFNVSIDYLVGRDDVPNRKE